MFKKQQSGFTLIELIIVIIILGILSVVAAPKFLNLSTDANIAVLEGLGGSIQSASALVYAKANIKNLANQSVSNLDINNDGTNDVATIFGYPSADRGAGIANVLDLADNWLYGDGRNHTQFHITSSSFSPTRKSGETNNNIQITSPGCYLTYTPSTIIGIAPTISYTTTGC